MDTQHMHSNMTEVINQNEKGTDFTSCDKNEQQVVNGGGGSKAEVKWTWRLGNRSNNIGKGFSLGYFYGRTQE